MVATCSTEIIGFHSGSKGFTNSPCRPQIRQAISSVEGGAARHDQG
jgi:hypothetical protein